jgi:hypothetical protein
MPVPGPPAQVCTGGYRTLLRRCHARSPCPAPPAGRSAGPRPPRRPAEADADGQIQEIQYQCRRSADLPRPERILMSRSS